MRSSYQIVAAKDPRPGHQSAHPGALKALREEEDLWTLSLERDKAGRRCHVVKRGETVRHRFYEHQAARDCLDDVGLTAAIMAAAQVVLREPTRRSFNMARRFR